MQIIDLETWDRKEHYQFFRGAAYAHYHIGADLDITHFKNKIKTQGLPFSFAMTYAATAAMNMVEAFRYRIHAGEVVLYDVIQPAFTYVAPDKKYFKFIVTDLSDNLAAYVAEARCKALAQAEYFVAAEMRSRDDFVFISSIPKVSFTHLSHTVSANKDDAVPRLSWGKYYERDGRLLLPLNVQAHHAFVDGDHMGDYMEALQQYLDTY